VKYINEIVRPQVAAGAERAGRTLADVALASSVFVITGENEAAFENMRRMAREQIAFYASTPTYRVVMAAHGWQDAGEQLSRLATMKRWDKMGAVITDEMLEVFAVQAPLDQLGQALRARYDGVLDRVACYIPFVPGAWDDTWRDIAATVHRS
jgi:hypothetical protein